MRAKQRADRVGQRHGVACRHEPTREALSVLHRRDDGLGQRADLRQDDRATHGLRPNAGSAEGFRHQRRHDRHMRGEKRHRHIVAMADEPHFFFEPVTSDEPDQLLTLSCLAWRIAGKDDHHTIERAIASQRRRGLDGLAVAFQPREPRRLQHDLGFRRNPPAFP